MSSILLWIVVFAFAVLAPSALLATGFCLDRRRRQQRHCSSSSCWGTPPPDLAFDDDPSANSWLFQRGFRKTCNSGNYRCSDENTNCCCRRRRLAILNFRSGSCLLASRNSNEEQEEDTFLLKTSSSGDDDDKLKDDAAANNSNDGLPTPFHQRGMAAALFSTYATVMAAKCALPAVMSQLTSPTRGLEFTSNTMTAQQLLARQLAFSTLAISLGKVVLGPWIDHVGGVRALQVALTTLLVLMGMIASSQSFLFFAICWIVVDFIFSSCWAACINAIHQTFPQRQWGQRISMLAIAARTGNASAFAFFAWLLHLLEHHVQRPWRLIFAISATLQVIPIALLTYFGKQRNNDGQRANSHKSQPPSLATSLTVLGREARTPEFWCHLVSRSALMVFASFLLFVPTLMHVVYGASNAVAAQCGSLYALGCLLAVLLGGGGVYANLSRRGKLASMVLCLGSATLASLAQLFHMMGRRPMSIHASMVCFFVWGLSFSIPFYLPPSLYALARGGQDSSATIADVFDIGGFGLLAWFNGYVAGIAQTASPTAWITTFQLTTACSVASLLSLSLGILLE